ncbi:TPA: kinase inhibitor [Yersinia enterocolitica]
MKKAALSLAIIAVSLSVQAQTFSVTSTNMPEGKSLQFQQVFNGFGCEGGNQSPQLSWQGAPAGAKSFAITAYDPDAPTGSGWWHWTVVNIPADTHQLATNAGQRTDITTTTHSALPKGAIQGRNDFGYAGFGGACPPVGDKPHRYQFTVWALKTDQLPLDSNASGALVGFMLNSSVIAKAELVATYGR